MLTHSSGTPNMTSFPGFVKNIMRNSYSPLQLVNLFADSTLQFKPGERFAYSNSGYILLGHIIEKVTGKPYEQVLQENLFTPLRMINTGYDHDGPLVKGRASGYEKNGRRYVNANFIDMSVPYAAGAMYSTVEDLYLWDQALYGNQLLRKENMDLLFTKHISSGGGHYGYGWNIGEIPLGNTEERIKTVGHGGGINGFNTQITRIPSDKSLIVLLNNTGGAPLNEMTNAIAAILYDKSYEFPKRSVAYSLADKIETEGLPTALEYYKGIKDSPGYYLNEYEMNTTGYQFLQSGRAKEAAAIFKLNTQAFPKSSNTYEYLKLLEGEYQNVDNKEWKIIFAVEGGTLYGNDRGYRYKVLPVGGEGEFVNPDDGASLVFDTKDKNAITMVLFGRVKFKKGT